MGDADWLREIGLNWGWNDNYPGIQREPDTSGSLEAKKTDPSERMFTARKQRGSQANW
jgi:hypothetical protein